MSSSTERQRQHSAQIINDIYSDFVAGIREDYAVRSQEMRGRHIEWNGVRAAQETQAMLHEWEEMEKYENDKSESASCP